MSPLPSRLFAAGALGVLAAACVTTEVGREQDEENDPTRAGPLVIPFDEGMAAHGGTVVDEFYESILEQLQEAYEERNAARLRSLLEQHGGERAPRWARRRLADFALLLQGLGFEQWFGESSRLELDAEWRPEDGPAPPEGDGGRRPLGAPLRMNLWLGAGGRPEEFGEVRLHGRDGAHPAAFQVTFRFEDVDPLGGRTSHRQSRMVRLERSVDLDEEPAVLPVGLEAPGGRAVIRRLDVRVTLVPGLVQLDGRVVPHPGVPCGRLELVAYPPGVGAIERDPLTTLRAAQRLGDPAHFRHLFLAAHFMPDDQRGAAARALIDWVRVGSEDQGVAAMAALRELTGEDIALGDREGWLRWWQRRRDG